MDSWAAGRARGLRVRLRLPVEQPVKHTLTGRVIFVQFPAADRRRQRAILVLDRNRLCVRPAHSFSCMSATACSWWGVSEFPENVIESSPVSVTGTIFESTSRTNTARFLNQRHTLLPRGGALRSAHEML